jgi:thioredoxin reductase (NADPH)
MSPPRSLSDAGVKVVRSPLRVEQTDECIAFFILQGEGHLPDMLYLALGCAARSDIAINLGTRCTDAGTLEMDQHQQTRVECVYVAGDVLTDLHQLTVATGDAAVAATNIHNRASYEFSNQGREQRRSALNAERRRRERRFELTQCGRQGQVR